MKKFLFFLLIMALVAFGIYKYLDMQYQKEQDYEKIEKVRSALEKVVKSKAVYSFDNLGKWYIFDIRVAYQSDEAFYKALQEELGEDFDGKLSNGDYFFCGVLPVYESVKVFAGGTKDNNMIFPDWNYTKLKER